MRISDWISDVFSSDLNGRIALTRRFLRPEAAYLVTGGTGGLGPEFARWLVARGAGEVVLVARHAPADGQVIELLPRMGGQVRFVAADVADSAQVEALIGGLDRPLAGVLHSAGVLDDGVLAPLAGARCRAGRPAQRAGATAI